MANSVSHCFEYPVKGARFTVAIPFLDSTGAPVDPTSLDTEFSLDGGAFADTAEEVTVISGSNGVGYITFTGAETNGSVLAARFKNSAAKDPIGIWYPRPLPTLYSVTALGASSTSVSLPTSVPRVGNILMGCVIMTTGGTGGGGTGGANNQARLCTAWSTGGTASVTPGWEVTPDSTTTIIVCLTNIAHFASHLIGLPEPAAAPAWGSSTHAEWIAWVGAHSRNKKEQTSSQQRLRNDADSGNLSTAAVSDDGTTFVRGEWS